MLTLYQKKKKKNMPLSMNYKDSYFHGNISIIGCIILSDTAA